MSPVLRTQLGGAARRPARLLLTGLAMLVASFVVYATVLAQQITLRTALDTLSGTPEAVDLVVDSPDTENAVPVTTTQLGKIKAVPGVAEAVGRVETGGEIGGQYLGVTGDPGTGPLSVVRVTQGRYPAAPNEIAVTPRTASRMSLPVGTRLGLKVFGGDDKDRTVQLQVVGIVAPADDYGSVAYAPQSSVTALTGGDTLQQIDVRLDAGADADAVRTAIAATGGKQAPEVRNGADVRLEEANRAAADLNALFAVVGMFIAIAVVAAGLVAASTFRIVFAQRMRQLALLRAVGAGRGAIVRALAAEGVLTGLAAGVAGVLGALAVGSAVPPILRLFDITVAGPGVPVLPALGVVALAVVVTLLAVIAPAASASRVAPLEALRAAATTAGKHGIGKLRWVFGLLLGTGAALSAGYVATNLPGRDTKDYQPDLMLLAIVFSGALAYFALIALGPVLMRPVLAVVGLPLRRLGPVGRLAVGGVGGATRRAAAVAVVVALGVTLIAGVVVSGASLRVLADRELASSAPADFELTAGEGSALPADLVTRAAGSSQLRHVTTYRRLNEVQVGAAPSLFDANDLDPAALPELSKIDVAEGSLADLRPGTVALSGWANEGAGVKLGDRVEVSTGKGKHRLTLTVAAILPDSAPLGSSVLLHRSDLDKLGAPALASGLLADAAQPGEDGRTAAQQALRQVMENRSGLGLNVLADQRDEANEAIDAVLAIALGLIGLTVLIAVVGVGTTVALSVVERARESGLLRAVGLTRGGLRAMLTTESGLYGVIGAVLGLLLGVPYAWLAVKALGVNAPLRLPVLQLLAVFGALVAFTALAGVLPARRAARVSPVVALGTE
ncbi:putative ABC transport system permease protein [Krasilnikovia cinnamomea]|uniref:Putative ABC transport system permease protein n=1 Tax=Krasilnikovia cinnamomea TaxID=349313 RepID=A0A4Q7ZEA7_9ACTN|nr:FtsX family ABC transporter permease [Krasilnikovia cinnamomea]RZU48443.1 putative ABC transport system permease protein [Krasilnikovia cinnamomea]